MDPIVAATILLLLGLRGGGVLLASPVDVDFGYPEDYVGAARQMPPEDDETATENVQINCPGYVRGVDTSKDSEDCNAGNVLGAVNHEQAFGFSTGSVDWTTCNLPEYPASNSRSCYRTAIYRCLDGYKIYLNKRNFKGLSEKCPSEQKELAQSGDDIIFPSPQYKCMKRSVFHNYRPREFCLYNISIQNCQSGRVLIETQEQDPPVQEQDPPVVEERDVNGTCSDYLQFYYKVDNSTAKTRRYCGVDFDAPILDVIPSTQFIAVFWTDISHSYLGFSLRVRCQEQVSSGEYPLTP